MVSDIALGQDKSWTWGPFEKPMNINPIITPDSNSTFFCPMEKKEIQWEAMATFNPAAVVYDDKINVLYRAEDKTGEMIIGGHTSRIGLAISEDGMNYERKSEPILFPKEDNQKKYEWPGGCEDPRIVETEGGTFILTYTQWNRITPRLAVATSKNLSNWTKHGPAFENAYNGKYLNMESKSGAILSRLKGDKLVATKVNGKYWMYFGVPKIWIATSTDLINWTPVEDEDGNLVEVLSPRDGYFDSWLVEAGPPSVLTDKGIMVLYNAGNSKESGDPKLGDRVYSGGQALFDKDNPMKLLKRTDEPFIKPEMPYEKTGQYEQGTTFLEGLVFFDDKWFLYYGTADSRVGLAIWEP